MWQSHTQYEHIPPWNCRTCPGAQFGDTGISFGSVYSASSARPESVKRSALVSRGASASVVCGARMVQSRYRSIPLTPTPSHVRGATVPPHRVAVPALAVSTEHLTLHALPCCCCGQARRVERPRTLDAAGERAVARRVVHSGVCVRREHHHHQGGALTTHTSDPLPPVFEVCEVATTVPFNAIQHFTVPLGLVHAPCHCDGCSPCSNMCMGHRGLI